MAPWGKARTFLIPGFPPPTLHRSNTLMYN